MGPQRVAYSLRSLTETAFMRYQRLSFHGKVAICFLLLFYVCLIAFIALATPSRIAQFMYDLGVEIRRLPYGYFILIAAIVLVSFPPFIGHSTLTNLCGFTYGIQGFVPAAISTLGGSALAFLLLRSLFGTRLRKWINTNDKWRALEAVIVSAFMYRMLSHRYASTAEQRARGLPLIILIRISPFPPWVYSNSLFASIESVSLTQFVFATLFVLPRVMIYVLVGSRIASLSDGEQRGQMDMTTKFINLSLIVGGIAISVISSLVVYRLVNKEIKSLHSSHSATDDGIDAEALEDAEEGAPLLVHS